MTWTFTPYLKDYKRKTWYVTDYGKCMRGLWYERKGKEKTNPLEEWIKKIGKQGKKYEDVWVNLLSYHKNEIEIIQQYQVRYDNIDVHGRIDVITKAKNETRPVCIQEIKTMNSDRFWKEKKKEQFNPVDSHIHQLNFYEGAKNLQSEFPERELMLIYIPREPQEYDTMHSVEDYSIKNIQEIPLTFNQQMFDEDYEWFTLLNDAWKIDKLPPVPELIVWDMVDKKWVINFAAKSCEYHGHCLEDKNWLKKATEELKLKT